MEKQKNKKVTLSDKQKVDIPRKPLGLKQKT